MVRMETSRPKLRWYQYSLRSLFIFVTLVCIAFGLYIGPKNRRHQAVVAIEKAGGIVAYADAPGDEWWFKRTLRQYLPRDWFDEVDRIHINNYEKADEHVFAALEQFNELKSLDLRNTRITDAGLIHLKGLTGLLLDLSVTQITDAGLIHLKGLTGLQVLHLDGTQITDAGLIHLKGLTGLQELDLHNRQITDAGLAQLKKALPNCAMYGGSSAPSEKSQPADDSPSTSNDTSDKNQGIEPAANAADQ